MSREAEILAVLKAQHTAIDMLFAQLIEVTRKEGPHEPFMPSRSGQPWQACVQGNALIKRLEGGA